MADDVVVDNATNGDYTVSTDEGAGGHVQRVKLTYSADGSETHVGADADGLLVNLGANNDVSVTGTVAVTAAVVKVALWMVATLLVDWKPISSAASVKPSPSLSRLRGLV